MAAFAPAWRRRRLWTVFLRHVPAREPLAAQRTKRPRPSSARLEASERLEEVEAARQKKHRPHRKPSARALWRLDPARPVWVMAPWQACHRVEYCSEARSSLRAAWPSVGEGAPGWMHFSFGGAHEDAVR